MPTAKGRALTMAELNILEAIRTAMDEELRDPNVMVLGEDVARRAASRRHRGPVAKYGEKRVLTPP
jgi:pyruvate/2-oxoglutarate/acetoin dehydrogenase E1 component